MGTGSFPGVKSGRGVTLTPHPLLVPLSWKGRAITLLPLWAFVACTEPQCLYKGDLYLYFYIHLHRRTHRPCTTQARPNSSLGLSVADPCYSVNYGHFSTWPDQTTLRSAIQHCEREVKKGNQSSLRRQRLVCRGPWGVPEQKPAELSS